MSLSKAFSLPIILAALVAGALLAFPEIASADDTPSNSSASVEGGGEASGESENPSSEPSLTAAQVAEHDYSDVVNYQVVGDFYYIMVVDTVLLAMCVGAIGWLSFRVR